MGDIREVHAYEGDAGAVDDGLLEDAEGGEVACGVVAFDEIVELGCPSDVCPGEAQSCDDNAGEGGDEGTDGCVVVHRTAFLGDGWRERGFAKRKFGGSVSRWSWEKDGRWDGMGWSRGIGM